MSHFRRTDVYEIMSGEAELNTEIDNLILSAQREWALENLVREVAEETGICRIPDSILDLSANFLGFVPGYSPNLLDRVVGDKLQLPFVFKYKLNSLPKIDEREEHDESVWLRWPLFGFERPKKVAEIRPLLTSILDGELVVTCEGRRADVLRIVQPTERLEEAYAGKVGPLSVVTQTMLIHCLTAEASGGLR